ncbi:hypothetical protein [Streptomyces sp. NPDC005096]|uniref:hypothetical protein n=1 Tax=Streptomyces sp. NPDC005096 TaxID=3154559 RepID=UPI0033A9B65D
MTDARWKTYALMIENIGTYRATKVSELLSVAGRVKAGVQIVEGIERELAANNIGHFPPRIPRDQNARVLLYNQDRAGLGFLMHMVRQLTEGQDTAGATADEQIRLLSMLLDGHRLAPKEDAAPA